MQLLTQSLNQYFSKYDNIIALGDFNAEMPNTHLQEFCAIFSLKNLIKEPTCFKSLENPTGIDHILTNHPKSFQHSGTYETGLSDFHKLTYTVLKMHYSKQQHKVIKYRCYKKFDPDVFRSDLLKELSSINLKNDEFDEFKYLVFKVLEAHAPVKEKYIRYNQGPFMTNDLRKAIMNRSRLFNKFKKDNSEQNKWAYKKQRNLCVKLLKKAKRTFYNTLDVKKISDNKTFWKTIKPNFTEKTIKDQKITLVENDSVISEDSELAEVFSKYFENVVKNLNIQRPIFSQEHDDPIANAITNFEQHPSILKIKENRNVCSPFSFEPVSLDEITKETLNLDASKATQKSDIPTKIIKQNQDIFSEFIFENVNNVIDTDIYPEQLKWADVKPAHKRGSRTDKENFRPVSILPNISKIYERCLFKQLTNYFKDLFSKYQCGFRKGFSVANCLLPMIEKWRESLDQGGAYGVLLTDLSKAFDCLSHDLLIAKLHAYGLDIKSLRLMYSYLTNRKQRVKINDTYSSWSEILFGVPQGSILGPLLFNIFICDLFLFISYFDITNYADDNTPYSANNNIVDVLNNLKLQANILDKWFKDNYMKANPGKYHLLLSATEETNTLNIEDICINSSKCEKLLGINIDSNLTFETHVELLCKKASQKLNALLRVTWSLNFDQRKLLLNAFITSHFSYAPVVWMFHSRKLNNRINKIHERALRLVYKDYTSSFDDLLAKDNSFKIHQRNLQKLAIEIFKVKKGIAPAIMNSVFELNDNPYSLRNDMAFFKSRNVHTVRYGIETASFVGPRIWNSLPQEIKESTSLQIFKSKIKSWTPKNCPCKLCKNYIQHLGYL